MENASMQKRESSLAHPERIDQGIYYTPLVDIVETDSEFLFQMDLPGVKPSDLDVSYDNGVLTVDAKVSARQPAESGFLWQEYGVGHFYRSFNLNTPVNAEGIRAELKNGELQLHVPKAESARTRKIEIKSS